MRPLRVLELYCGIGGCAVALADPIGRGSVEIALAVDVNRHALGVYALNLGHPTRAGTVESLSGDQLRRLAADLWWLSPPCQPFTVRGKQRDLDDPRAATFVDVLEKVEAVRPRYLALENVPGFRGSRLHARLVGMLQRAGYRAIRETLLCPSELGIPSRRRRYYLVASRDRLLPSAPPEAVGRRLAETLEPVELISHADWEPEALAVDPEVLDRYRHALHVVDADDPRAVTRCFTSAYGRSFVRSGSYLRPASGPVRRFSPTEILRLLGFGPGFRWPPDTPVANAWRLAGNSLSIDAVRHVLAAIPFPGARHIS